jgi:hypothetical protein
MDPWICIRFFRLRGGVGLHEKTECVGTPFLGNHKNANGLAKFLFVTVTTTALFALVSRNLPALSFLSARHIDSPLRVKHKNSVPK